MIFNYLSNSTKQEKFTWLTEAFGDYQALEMLVQKFDKPGVALELLVVAFQTADDACTTDDLIGWFLEGSQAYEAVEFFETLGHDCEFYIDALVNENWNDADLQTGHLSLDDRNRL